MFLDILKIGYIDFSMRYIQKTLQIILFFLLFLSDTLRGQEIPLTVIYTNNNNGNIQECECEDLPFGGLARRKTVFDRIRKENKNVITLDAGDFLDQFGSKPAQDELVIRLYGKLGYDGINIGDNELANETDFFSSKLVSSQLPLVSASITDLKGQKVTKPYILRTVSNISIALIGYTPQSSFQFFPGWKKLEVKIENEREKLKQAVNEVTGKADMIILLSNAGDDEDYVLAKAFPMIDIIVGGHNQVELEEPVQIGKTIIVQAGGNGGYVGQLSITHSNGRVKVVKNKLIPLDKNTKDNPEIKKTIDEFLSLSESK